MGYVTWIIGLKYNKLDYVRQNNKIGLFWDNQHIEKSEPFRYFSLNNLEDIVSDYTFLQYSGFVFCSSRVMRGRDKNMFAATDFPIFLNASSIPFVR